VLSEEGRFCRFEIDLAAGIVERVRFRASPCISLIAYSEWISQRVEGWPIERALGLTASEVIDGVPEIRETRHLRARLALRALQSACAVAGSFEFRFGPVSRANVGAVAWSI